MPDPNDTRDAEIPTAAPADDLPTASSPGPERSEVALPSGAAALAAGLEALAERLGESTGGRTPAHTPVEPVGALIRGGPVPASIPGYEILEELAHGGMGVVYRARDLSLAREIAIKTLLPEFARRADLALQFDREARITARLPHPGVPPVYTLGTLPDGRPFLGMKLIRGRTLHEELRAARHAGSFPRLLGVFEQICQTVGYAHSVGVIHRDLKPLNVMVGAFGEVQVMDWGLAKSGVGTDGVARFAGAHGGAGDGYTSEPGRIVGTPAYMPPEQARGDWASVDARADVFALGGILCNLLVGTAPYTGGSSAEVLLKAQSGDLREAFARLDGCGADPELISLCKRCLWPDPLGRPADGKSVADEVTAYRAGIEERARKAEAERVAAEARAEEAARRVEAEERARHAAEARVLEQRKRRRTQLALAGSVGLLLLGGVGFAWWQSRQVEQAKLRQAQFDAGTARQEAARLTAESLVREQQKAVQSQLDRNRLAALAFLDQAEVALRTGDAEKAAEALERAGKRIAEGGADEFKGRLALRNSDLNALRKFDLIDADIWTVVNGKMTPIEKLAQRWSGAFAEYGIAPGSASPQATARLIEQSLIRERLLTSLETWFLYAGRPPALRTVLELADPDEFRNEARATDYQRAATRRAFRGQPLPAPPLWFAVAHGLDRDLDARARQDLILVALGSRPNSLPLLLTLHFLENPYDPGTADRRAGWCRAALAVSPRSTVARVALGQALRDQGKLDAAIAVFQEAIRLDERYIGPRYAVGLALMAQKKIDQAIAVFREAVQIAPDNGMAHEGLASAFAEIKDWPRAIASFREVVRLEPRRSDARYNLGNAYLSMGEPKLAAVEFREGTRLAPRDKEMHFKLGEALGDIGDVVGATAAFRESVRLDPKFAKAHRNLGVMLGMQGNLKGALTELRDAIRLDPNDTAAHFSLGIALAENMDTQGAIAAFREAVRCDPGHTLAHLRLGQFLFDQRKYPEAIASVRAAVRLEPTLADAHAVLGVILLETRDLTGARAAFSEAARLDPKQWGQYPNKVPPPPVAPPPREK